MPTKILTTTEAAKFVSQGGILAYPTESVWGLGCDPNNHSAFEKLLALKQRPQEKGVILVAADFAQALPYLDRLTTKQQNQLKASWEDATQATTWLVPLAKDTAVPAWISGRYDSVAIRVTPHPLVQALCTAAQSAIVSTSCNPAGSHPAKTFGQAKAYFGERIAYLTGDTLGFDSPSRIVDAQTGQCLR